MPDRPSGAFPTRQHRPAAITASDTSTSGTHVLMVAAGREKERVNRAFAEYQAATKPTARAERRRSLVQLATHSYLPAVIRLRKGLAESTLTRTRDELQERLERGYAMDLDAAGERFFMTLLSQYEAVCDAISKDALGPLLERVNRHEPPIGGEL